MHRFTRMAGIAVVILALAAVSPASAQFVQVYYPAPVFLAPPSLPPVVTSYYLAPGTVYCTPSVSYYSAPPTTVYSPPVAYSSPGVVTAHTYRGFGIFRPRGFYTQYHYSPGVTSYYTPLFLP